MRTIQPLLKTSLLLLLVFFMVSCKQEPVLETVADLTGQAFPYGLKIDGHEFDSLTIENCQFTKRGLRIGNVDHLLIKNCTFKDIDYNGIAVGFIGPSEHIRIEDCSFENIGFNAIDSHEDAPRCEIRNCTFFNSAQSQTGAAMAQPHHAIYWKGKEVLIEDNLFTGGDQKFGNGISVRSSGIVRRNTILGFPKNAIMYYANHPGGDSLLIENNFLAGNQFSITVASPGILTWHNKRVIIRFNSMFQEKNHSLSIGAIFGTSTTFEVYGNAVVNKGGEFFKTFFDIPTLYSNLTSSEDIGFQDPDSGDLHLVSGSEAIGFCTGLDRFPSDDIDGDTRSFGQQNAGADE